MRRVKFKSDGWRVSIFVIVLTLIIIGLYLALPTGLWAIGRVISLFLPFILGYLFSLIINPLADKLQSKFKLPRGLSAILVIILTVGIIGGILAGVIWKIVEEMRSIYSHYPQIYAETVIMWENISGKFSDFYVALPDAIQNVLDNLGKQFSVAIADFFQRTPVVEKAGNFAKGLPGIFIGLIAFFLSLYFMVADAKKIRLELKKVIPQKITSKLYSIRTELKKYLGGYVKAQAIIMSIAFVVIFLGLSILGVNYALLIALVIAILDALPLFGSGAVLWPWAIISLLNGSFKLGIGLIIIYLAIALVRQMIEPKIVSSNIGLHPVMTLMAMYIGYKTFSIGGLILGPITLMLIISFYKAGVFDPVIKLLKNILSFIKNEVTIVKNIFKN